jgi:hypothetical protein
MSACTATDDAILKWNLAKRKQTVQKYGAAGGTTSAHAAVLSDVPASDAPADGTDSLPTLEDCADDYDDNEVSFPFSYVAFSSSLALGRNLSRFWVVDSAYSINLTAFRDDFVKFTPLPLPLAWAVSALTLRAVAQCGFLSDLPQASSFTAVCMHSTPLTYHLAPLSVSEDFLVSHGCRLTADVNSYSPPTLTLVCF